MSSIPSVGDYVVLYLPEYLEYVQKFVNAHVGRIMEIRTGYDSPYVVRFKEKDFDDCITELFWNDENYFYKKNFIKKLKNGYPFRKHDVVFHADSEKEAEKYLETHRERLERIKSAHSDVDPLGEEIWDYFE